MKHRFEKLTDNQFMARVRAEAMRPQVKQVCCDIGVPTPWLPNYYCFGMELDKLERMELTGETAALEADSITQKWLLRGMDPKVLDAIRTRIFCIPHSTP